MLNAQAPGEASSSTGNTLGQRGRPMWTVRGLVTALDRNEDKVVELIEGGQLLWAFDVAISLRQRELRVLPACVEDFQAERECKLGWEDVRRLVVPHDNLFVTAVELQRSLNVSCTHLSNLADCQRLACVKPGHAGRSAIFKAESFLTFLKNRRHL